MVKPPKSMQPEAVDLRKAGRKSGRAFQADSFQQYMARKIDLQRQQFGLILPPAPTAKSSMASKTPPQSKMPPSSATSSPSRSTLNSTTKTNSWRDHAHFSSPSRKRPRSSMEHSTTANSSSPPGISYNPLELRVLPTSPNQTVSKSKTRKRKQVKDAGNKSSSGGGMSLILKKLQQRHGDGRQTVLRHVAGRKKRHRSRHSIQLQEAELEQDGPATPSSSKESSPIHLPEEQSRQAPSPSNNLESTLTRKVAFEATNSETFRSSQEHAYPTTPINHFRKEIDHCTSIGGYDDNVDDDGYKNDGDGLQDIALEDQSQESQQTADQASCSDVPATPQSISKLKRDRPDLFFLGIVVKVNGYTDPDNESLKRMLHKHGGDLETYETTRVTHIVAEHISTAKANFLKKQKRPRPVVSPQWIVDSVHAQRLLPHADYLLEELKDNIYKHSSHIVTGTVRQVGLKDLFGSTNNKSSSKSTTDDSVFQKPAPVRLKSPPESNRHEVEPPSTDQTTTKESPRTPIIAEVHSHTPSTSVMASATSLTSPFPNHTPLRYPDPSHPSLQQESPELPVGHLNMAFLTQVDPNDISPAGPSSNLKRKPPPTTKPPTPVSALKKAPPTPSESNDSLNSAELRQQLEPATTNLSLAESVPGPTTASTERTVQYGGKTDAKYINGRVRTTGTDPNFLESFFANSRLSFIGSYKQRTSEPNLGSPQRASANKRSKQDAKRFVFHVDMDSFFASVVLRKYPEYKDKPVAISHHGQPKQSTGNQSGPTAPISDKSTSECATCNYKAREYGVKKGMFLGRAKQLCPELIVLQYDFEGYEAVSEQVLTILHRVSAEYEGCVEAVSCDEAYLELYLPLDLAGGNDVDENANKRAECIAETIREEIFDTTQCTASIGVAPNKFLAKVGTDEVKPNGSYIVRDYRQLLKKLRLRDLHGIGYRSEPKLSLEGLTTVQDVWDLGSNGLGTLEKILGPGLGKKIFDFCQGEDDREVKPAERKTIGAECNYGVRFDGPYGIDHFFTELSKEVERRMTAVGVKGTKLTLKVKQRKKGAKNPPKFLGHGSCHNISKSMDMPNCVPTRDAEVLRDICLSLFKECAVPLEDVRGMGMVISKLTPEDVFSNEVSSYRNSMMASWLKGASKPLLLSKDAKRTMETDTAVDDGENELESSQTPSLYQEEMLREMDSNNMEEAEEVTVVAAFPATQSRIALPPLSQIHMSQVAALPEEMQAEIRKRIPIAELQTERNESTVDHDIPPVQSYGKVSWHRSNSCQTYMEPERAKMRQTNVKRMMKLAAVQSGQTTAGMPLSQLDHLPLEIKLQIVNQDSDPLGHLSQRKQAPVARSVAKRPIHQEPDTPVARPSLAGRSGETHTIRKEITMPPDNMTAQKNEGAELEDEASLFVDPVDVYQDDIVPFNHFLDENTSSDDEAVSMVVAFFTSCLQERRLCVAVSLLRNMLKRDDGWCEKGLLAGIAERLDDIHFRQAGFRLDLDWILQSGRT